MGTERARVAFVSASRLAVVRAMRVSRDEERGLRIRRILHVELYVRKDFNGY
jgi:hypothetical protein